MTDIESNVKNLKSGLSKMNKDELETIVALGIAANHEIVERIPMSEFDAMEE